MASTPGFAPGPHCWEASALTTVPPLLPKLQNELDLSQRKHGELYFHYKISCAWNLLPLCVIQVSVKKHYLWNLAIFDGLRNNGTVLSVDI